MRVLRRAWALVDAAPVAIVECLDDGQTLVWNRAAERIFGWSASDVLGKPCPVLMNITGGPAEGFRDRALAGQLIDGEDVTVRRADGTTVEVSLSTAPVLSEQVWSVVATAVDVTDRVRISRRLHHFATHDALTELQNRRAFEHSLEGIVARVRGGGGHGALLVIDVDLLKRINDQFGHLTGDAMLIAVADSLRMATRPRDVVARIGGDEFAIALEDVHSNQISQIAGRVRASVGALRVGPGGAACTTASIGGVVIDGSLDMLEVIGAADESLYLAKRERDSFELCLEPRIATSAGDDQSLIAPRLQRALRVNTLAVHYQGVRNTEDGALYCEEALARLSLDGAYTRAADFVPLAVGSGLIGEIDRRVANLVLDRLDDTTPTRLSLNLSAASLMDSRPLAVLRERAPSDGYNQRLILEARESDLLADPGRAASWAQSVHELGAAIAIDDFDAAKATVAEITALPADLIKFDGSIVAALADRSAVARVRDLTSACRDLGIAVVAKGVQDAATLEMLPEVGINLAQGFLIEPPHPVIGLADLLETAAEFGQVSADLVAWEFMVPETALRQVWLRALEEQFLLRSQETDPDTGEAMYVLTARGQSRLRDLRMQREH